LLFRNVSNISHLKTVMGCKSLFCHPPVRLVVTLLCLGHATAQAVSHQLPITATRVRAQVRSCGICGGQSGAAADFLLVLRFPLPILIPPTAPYSSPIVRGGYNRPFSGRRTKWTQSHPTARNKKKTTLRRTFVRNMYTKLFNINLNNLIRINPRFTTIWPFIDYFH
jgi:hypothetical protein